MSKNTSVFMFSAFQKECLTRFIKGKEATIAVTSYEYEKGLKRPVWFLDGLCGVVFWNDREFFLSNPFNDYRGTFNNMLAGVEYTESDIVYYKGIKRDTGKHMLVQLSNDNGREVYANEKYLKYFDYDLDVFQFYACTSGGMLIVKWNDYIVGILGLIRFKNS